MSTADPDRPPARARRAPGPRRGTPRHAAVPRAADTPGRRTPLAPATTPTRAPAGTAPFVLLIMVLLTGGLVATLWLSTAAAADSYRLDEARQVARDLSEQSERLHRDVEAAQSAPALAAAARAQGMVPAGEPAVLVVAPDGSSQVVGDPKPAQAVAPPPRSRSPPPAGRAATTAAPRTRRPGGHRRAARPGTGRRRRGRGPAGRGPGDDPGHHSRPDELRDHPRLRGRRRRRLAGGPLMPRGDQATHRAGPP